MSFLNLKKVPSLDFIGMRLWTFGISGIGVLSILLVLLMNGLPYGVDFKGGVILEVRAPNAPKLDDIRTAFSEVLEGDASIQTLDDAQDFLVRFDEDLFEADKEETLSAVRKLFGKGADIRRMESVGPKVSNELLGSGLTAVFFALLAMLFYIWFRFEWRYGLAALCALLHDCIAVVGLYVLGRVEFAETAIVAVLITAAYSINDTVVIFDRVRENKGRYGRSMPLKALLNLSVNETLSRTLLTSLTTLAALLVLYFFGGRVIASFSLPILIGLSVGTYSSICLATPLLFWLSDATDVHGGVLNQNSKKAV